MYFRIAIVKYVDDRRELLLHSLFNEIMLLYGHGTHTTWWRENMKNCDVTISTCFYAARSNSAIT